MQTLVRLGLLALAFVSVAAAEPAALAASALPTGRLVERISCSTAPSQSYALYLPSAYEPSRAWPILFVLDARGRAVRAAERFVPGAETFGYIVVSSYDTASDGASQPNIDAMNAMLADTQLRFALDVRRFYIAGFSGTARVAWALALHLPGSVAGILGASGGLPQGLELPESIPFAFFGSAGRTDFNYQEMRRLDETLERKGAPHLTRFFAGGHDWPPAPLVNEALGWFELEAMRTGQRAPDAALLARTLDQRLDAAAALETEEQWLEAKRAYEAVVTDAERLARSGRQALEPPLDEHASRARQRAEELGRRHEISRAAREEKRLASQERHFERELGVVIQQLRDATQDPPPLARLVSSLGIHHLEQAIAKAPESSGADSAQRRLATAFTQTSFYLPRELRAEGQVDRAELSLALALQIDDSRAAVWYNYACAQAQAGKRRNALESLATAVERGFADANLLQTDPDLDTLRETEEYHALLSRLERANTGSGS